MKTFILLFSAVIATTFVSCDKGDLEIKKMNRGDGTWTIESVRTEQYDSVGQSVINSNTVDNAGEFIFFRTGTLNALFDEHLLVVSMVDTSGTAVYTGGAYYDDNRVKVAATSPLDGVWTVDDNGRRKQQWSIYEVGTDGYLDRKMIMVLKKK